MKIYFYKVISNRLFIYQKHWKMYIFKNFSKGFMIFLGWYRFIVTF